MSFAARARTPRLGYDVAVTPAVDSDFRQHSSQAPAPVTGHGIAAWTCSPTLTLVLGDDSLPHRRARCCRWPAWSRKPNDNAKFEPGVSATDDIHRFYWNGIVNQDIEDWIYIGGELGGGTWAIQRGDGANDVLSYRDLRVFLGVERKAFGRLSPRFEVGYVFARKLQLDQAATDFVPQTPSWSGPLAY